MYTTICKHHYYFPRLCVTNNFQEKIEKINEVAGFTIVTEIEKANNRIAVRNYGGVDGMGVNNILKVFTIRTKS